MHEKLDSTISSKRYYFIKCRGVCEIPEVDLLKISDVAQFTVISNEQLVLLKIFMLLPYYIYFY